MYIFLLFVLILILAIILILLNVVCDNNIKNGGGKHKRRYKTLTYKIFYNGEYTRETYSYIINRLNSLGWKEAPNAKKYVNFAFSLLNNNGRISADLKYALNGHKSIVYKDFLYKNMKNLSHIPPTEDLTTYKWCGDVVIIKEVLSYQQRGVYVVGTEEDFLNVKSKLVGIRAVVSKYIQNALLFEGKRFQLRINIILFIYRNKDTNKLIKKFLYKKDNIFTIHSKKKYIINNKDDYLDPEITITKGKYNERLIYFSEIEKQYSAKFIKKCKKSIDDAIHSISLDNISLYPEQKAGLFIYGADFMLDDTGHAWILELNSKPGFIPGIVQRTGGIEAEQKFKLHFFKNFFGFILDNIVLPYFKYLYS